MEDRVEEDPVAHRVDPAHRVQIGGGARPRPQRVQVQRQRDLGRPGEDRAQRRHPQAVGQVEVVRGPQRGRRLGAARGVHPGRVAEEGGAPGLVERGPVGHPVAERPGHEPRVLGEPFGGLPPRPAPQVLELLRQVPVVEGGDGPDPGRQQLVDEPPVEVQALLDGGPAAGGLDPRPGHREAVVAHAEPAEQGHVLAHAVVVVGGRVPGVAVVDLAGGAAEGVPDGGRPAVQGGRALDLVRGGGRAPAKAGREGEARLRDGRRVERGHGRTPGR